MRRHLNYAPGNAGPIFYLGDIFTPLLLICLLIVYRGAITPKNVALGNSRKTEK